MSLKTMFLSFSPSFCDLYIGRAEVSSRNTSLMSPFVLSILSEPTKPSLVLMVATTITTITTTTATPKTPPVLLHTLHDGKTSPGPDEWRALERRASSFRLRGSGGCIGRPGERSGESARG